MALLSAEDVLNKAFSKTKYREGFDQDEVDDFLDEVANTIAALTAERDELQARLAQAAAGGAVAASAATPATVAVPTGGLLAAATDPNPPTATTMLAMAQKLHDEYVQAGEEAREKILNEAKAKAEQIVEQAERDAQDRMSSLDSERADIERRIDDLRRFERDYRAHLRSYLSNLLGDLEHASAADAPAAVAPATPVFSAPAEQAPVTAPEEEPTKPSFVLPEDPGAPAFAEVPAAPEAPIAPAYSPYASAEPVFPPAPSAPEADEERPPAPPATWNY